MKPVEFPEQNMILRPAKGTEDYVQPLPCYNNGAQTISCWELTDEEVEEVVKTRRIYMGVFGGVSSPPVLPYAFSPFSKNAYAFAVMWFKSDNEKSKRPWIQIWNSGDFRVPEAVTVRNEVYWLNLERMPVAVSDFPLEVGSFYFRQGTPEEVDSRKKFAIAQVESLDVPADVKMETYAAIERDSPLIAFLCERLQAGKERVYGT
jgi:hypothetical protein